MKKLDKNQSGFGISGVLIFLFIIAGLAGVGYYVWKNPVVKTSESTTITQTNATKEPTCPENNYPAADNTTQQIPWINVTTTKINLCNWGVSVTLPAAEVGKAVYKYDKGLGEYLFSTHTIIDNQQCINFLFDTVDGDGSVYFYRYSGKDSSQVGLPSSTTLDQYYQSHKVSGSNYAVASNSPTVRYYKIGSYYFSSSDNGDDLAPTSISSSSLAANCKNVDPHDPQTFIDALATLSFN